MGFLKRLFNKRVRNRRKKNGDQDFGCGENPFGLIFSIVELVFLDQKYQQSSATGKESKRFFQYRQIVYFRE
jgi:hypothetical protein